MDSLYEANPVLLQEHFILDEGMRFPISSEYAVTGQKEGWLDYIHGMRDYRGIFVATYVHIPLELREHH